MTKMTKAQLEVENQRLREEIEDLKARMTIPKTGSIVTEEGESLLMEQTLIQLATFREALRPFANESILQMCDRMKKRENEGVDVGVRVGALRRACELLKGAEEGEDENRN